MTEYKNEYQKFADSAVRAREREEGFGRLRMSGFCGGIGGVGIILCPVLKFEPIPRPLAMILMGMAPLAVILLVVNFIRLPNEHKASASALLIGLVTLVAAGATLAIANYFQILKVISP